MDNKNVRNEEKILMIAAKSNPDLEKWLSN